MDRSRSQASLYQFFSGMTEYVFQTRLGVADPPLVEYISALLARFIHTDAIYKIRNLSGRRLEEVADMLVEAEARVGDARREVHRHIGDFTLFWTGVYPEFLRRMEREGRSDRLLDYRQQGKRAYYIASTIQQRRQPRRERSPRAAQPRIRAVRLRAGRVAPRMGTPRPGRRAKNAPGRGSLISTLACTAGRTLATALGDCPPARDQIPSLRVGPIAGDCGHPSGHTKPLPTQDWQTNLDRYAKFLANERPEPTESRRLRKNRRIARTGEVGRVCPD